MSPILGFAWGEAWGRIIVCFFRVPTSENPSALPVFSGSGGTEASKEDLRVTLEWLEEFLWSQEPCLLGVGLARIVWKVELFIR